MAAQDGLGAVLPLLLLLISVWSTAGATPSWDDPFFTANTTDNYIKDFVEASSVITIYEDVHIGHKIGVLHIIATPGDTVVVTQSGGGDEVVLSFDGSETEQNVYIQSGLDRETTDNMDVAVQLNEGSTSYFYIQVADVNDNRPMFDGNQGSQISLEVPENKLNDSLLTLTATDADLLDTATLTYSLDTEGYDDTFQLKSLTKDSKPACQLQLLQELDYETRPVFRMTITVKDTPDVRGTVQSSSVTVFVFVEDERDAPPRWLIPPMAWDVDENTRQGTELFTVEAIDGDTSANNDIRYSIISQSPDGFVEMLDDTTGDVTLKKDLDREDPDLADGFITIVIEAREAPDANPDQPCSDISCIIGEAVVSVNDLDDNAPAFDQTAYSVSFPENTTGAIDLLIAVNDADLMHPNNMIKLSFAGAPVGVFGLTSHRGPTPLVTYILVKDKDYMDYEKEDHRHISFQLMATDGTTPSMTSSAYVTINLIDIDD